MGMFDWINFVDVCPTCGITVTGFQSKDSSCQLNTLEYWEVNNFYSYCPKCKTKIEYNLIVKRQKIPIENYSKLITVRQNDNN